MHMGLTCSASSQRVEYVHGVWAERPSDKSWRLCYLECFCARLLQGPAAQMQKIQGGHKAKSRGAADNHPPL